LRPYLKNWFLADFEGNLQLRVLQSQLETSFSDRVAIFQIKHHQIQILNLLNKDIHQKKTFKAGLKFESDDVLFGKLRPYLKNKF
jgi:hypothetical protein